MAIDLFRLPFSSSRFEVTSYYGARSLGNHWGIDLRASTGTAIYSVKSGYVKVAVTNGITFPSSQKSESNTQFKNAGYGNYVVIEHTGGFCTLYAHLSQVAVTVGQQVSAVTVIGAAGDSGHSYGAHLHFETIDATYEAAFRNSNYNKRVTTYNRDPLPYLQKTANELSNGASSANNKYYENYPTQNNIEDYEEWLKDRNLGLENQVKLEKNLDGSYATYEANKLFGRKYRIVIYDEDFNGIDISDLHIIFNCKKTMTLDNSISTITVYNLNSATEGQIIQYARRVTIEAGYENLYGLVFEGDVIQAIRSKENATDYVLRILAMDGDRFQSQAFNAYSIIRGQTMREVIDSSFSGSSFKVNIDDNLQDSLNEKYIRGKVIFGKAYDNTQNLISSISNGVGYFEDGTFNLTKISDEHPEDVIDLDYDSGLVDVPQQSDYYVTFKALLNPRIKLNRFVHIKAEYIVEQEYSDGNAQYSLFEGAGDILEIDTAGNPLQIDANQTERKGYTLAKELGAQYTGVFRIVEIEFEGDTRGNAWYVNCKGVKQTGSIPSLVASSGANVYR